MNSALSEYELQPSQQPTQLQLPSGAEIRSVGLNSNGQITLVAEVDPEPGSASEQRDFVILNTGDSMPVGDWKLQYVGTAFTPDGQSQHVYEILGQQT